MQDTDRDRGSLRLPSCRIQAHLRPYESGYEWVVTEYVYDRRKWTVLTSGASAHFAVACVDLAHALEDVGAEAF